VRSAKLGGVRTNRLRIRWIVVLPVLLAGMAAASVAILNLQPFKDPTGYISTFNANGNIQEGNPFFQSLGTNGRSCASCHIAKDAFGLNTTDVQARFDASSGMDPLFAPVDGANCPDAAPGDANSRSLLLNNGLIHVSLSVPTNAEFTISVVNDPYGCALTTDSKTGQQMVSVYRRPLPTTNLRFLSTVMLDGRETIAPLNNQQTFLPNLVTDLTHQALDATMGHAQAAVPPTSAQLSAIVNFELGLSSAQMSDNAAGLLSSRGAQGGAQNLSAQPYYPGINDSLGQDPNGAVFNPEVFTFSSAWLNLSGQESVNAAKAAIAAGQEIFNNFPLTITAVRGLNDNAALGRPASISGTCTTCHDTPNVGNHSLPLPLDIGTSHAATEETISDIQNGLSQLSVPDLPIYKISGCLDPVTNEAVVFYTSDPGKALISGHCSDVNRIKGPILRGLAARAPYFHNGSAANLSELVHFYDRRFQMGLTDQQKAELIAFLNSL
jgi:cytochrome c peroxidase